MEGERVLCMLQQATLTAYSLKGALHTVPLPPHITAMHPLPHGLILSVRPPSSSAWQPDSIIIQPRFRLCLRCTWRCLTARPCRVLCVCLTIAFILRTVVGYDQASGDGLCMLLSAHVPMLRFRYQRDSQESLASYGVFWTSARVQRSAKP